jgi:uncharacterized protein (DUF924 family)
MTLLQFWFPDNNYHIWWFKSTNEFDKKIYNEYYNLYTDTFINYNIKNYSNSKKIINDIIILDQLSRNMKRINNEINIEKSTEYAVQLSEMWINNKLYLTEPIKYTVFALLPIRHYYKGMKNKYLLILLDEILVINPSIKNDNIFKKFYFHTSK